MSENPSTAVDVIGIDIGNYFMSLVLIDAAPLAGR
jgi:hypothetical protein